jgi:outer membrane receptor for ferrienterochelin and colicins
VLRPRVSWQSPEGGSLFLTAGTTLEQRDGGTLDGRTAPDGAPFAEALHTARFDGGAVARLPLNDRTRVVLRGSGMVQRHRHRFGEIREDDRHQTWFAEATVSREVGPSIVVGGAALQGEGYRSEQIDRFDYRFSVPGVFLHTELAGPGPLITALSVRLDHHSRYGTFFNPRLSFLARPGEGWSVRISAGSGYFAPTPFTEETEVTGLSRLAALGTLAGERARSASLDVQRQAGRVELSATLFGSAIDDAVQLAERPAGAELVNASAPTRTYGADLVARYRSELVGVTASYTWTRATEPHPETGVRREVPLTPRHAAGLVVVHERHGVRRMGLELYYTGPQSLDDQTYLTRSKPYLIVGALAEQRIGQVRVFLNLENLGGVRQTNYVPLVRPARAPDGRWTTDAWGPLEGRVINGGVRLSW